MTATRQQSPTDFLRRRISDLEELRRRVDEELVEKRQRLARIERASSQTGRNIVPPGTRARDVREWGAAHGWILGDRGRLPADLIRAYLNRRSEPNPCPPPAAASTPSPASSA